MFIKEARKKNHLPGRKLSAGTKYKDHDIIPIIHEKDRQILSGLNRFRGILLVFSAMAAIIIANTPLYGIYDYILHEVHFRIGFINEGAAWISRSPSRSCTGSTMA
jgi:hypothetical protein